jgi:hypothetical protein
VYVGTSQTALMMIDRNEVLKRGRFVMGALSPIAMVYIVT